MYGEYVVNNVVTMVAEIHFFIYSKGSDTVIVSFLSDHRGTLHLFS
jgi:hypothetical protein